VVAQQLAADHLDLPANDVLGVGQQISDRDLGFDPVAGAVHVPLRETGEVEDGLPQCLGRDRAGIDAHPAHHVAPLGHAHTLTELGGRDRSLLATGPGSDHQQVVVVPTTVLLPIRTDRVGRLHRSSFVPRRHTRQTGTLTAHDVASTPVSGGHRPTRSQGYLVVAPAAVTVTPPAVVVTVVVLVVMVVAAITVVVAITAKQATAEDV
jgi:hypothetical protein